MKTISRDELGAFLRVRRAELQPEDVGLTNVVSHRRVPGLRREEVAQLATISTDYYTRLEQGRISVSRGVLVALARALRLTEDQRAYLYELAGEHTAAASRPQRTARPYLRRLLDHLADTPAMVANRTFDVLAWNPLAAELILDFDHVRARDRNFVRLLFTHPALRHRYTDWEEVARASVAYLRMEVALTPDDSRLVELVGELSARDPLFRQWWCDHHVAVKRRGVRTFEHPAVGRLTLDWDTVTSDADPDQHLIVYTAEPGSPASDALATLASRCAERRSV